MKKNLISMGLMAVAALTLTTNCTSIEFDIQETTPTDAQTISKGTPFEIVAKAIKTKTTNDGMSTDWAADDGINLFHRENGTTGEYGTNDQFTIASEDLTDEVFKGTLTEDLEDGRAYDWWALYPYNASYTTPANTTYSGSIGAATKTQSGYGNTAHLQGTTLPLVGKATNVAYNTTPSITMKHVASLVKIIVTNDTSESLTITSVQLTAPEKIVGSFKINFADPENLVITNGAYSPSETATLNVSGGTALANGESATFYIPVKPFSLAKDDVLTIKVNTYSKELAMTKAVSFVSGGVKTINFSYDKSFTSQNFYLASSIADGDKVIFTNSTGASPKVMGHYSSGNNVKPVDGTNTAGRIASTSSMAVFTVAYDAEKGYSFYDPENETYLNATSTTDKNYLKGISPIDSYAYWNVAIDNNAVLTNKGKASRNVIKYNTNDNFFSAYNSDYTTNISLVYIYKYDSRTPVTLSFSSPEISKTTANYGEFEGQPVTVSPTVSPITYAMTGDNIGSITPATGAVSLNGNTGTATVTATFAGNETYMSASASYTITVASAGATYYRKVTAAPDGGNWAGTYLLVNETNNAAFDGGYNGTTGGTDSDVTITESKIESNVTVDSYAVTITKVGDHYAIKHGDNYLGWASGNKAQPYANTDSDNALNDFAIDGGAAIIKSAADNTRILRYNPGVTRANGRLRYYTTNTGTVVVLYKKD